MTSGGSVSRRDRLRAQVLAEIRDHAEAQLARGGVAALSLNAIARAMGMSGPAMYRYFASRDALLDALMADSYDALAAALEEAERTAGRRAPARRVAAVADAYRAWALGHPHRYRLIFGAAHAGASGSEAVVSASHRAMEVFLRATAALPASAAARHVPDATLRRQLTAWVASRSAVERYDAGVVLAAVEAWTRLHGVLSLELEGFFDAMGLDAARLHAEEVRRLVEPARSA